MPTKERTPTFTVELALSVDTVNERFLSKAFLLGTQIQNGTLSVTMGRLQHLRESPAWREAQNMPDGAAKTKRFSELRKNAGLNQNSCRKLANDIRKKTNRGHLLGAHEAENLGDRVWQAVEAYMFGEGGRLRYKSTKKESRGLHSISGTDNREIIYHPGSGEIYWRKHHLKIIEEDTPYLREAIADPNSPSGLKTVKFCRIVWRRINGTKRWFVQLALEGIPPQRIIPAPQDIVMGIDPGPSKIAYFTEQKADIIAVSKTIEKQEKEIADLNRRIDRSRRANNPDNYNEDKTIKPGPKEWKVSKAQKKLEIKRNDLYRRLTAARKDEHGRIINLLIQMAGTIKIEKNSYLSFQRGLFGKSSNRYAMGAFMERLIRKAEKAGCKVVLLDARKYRMSQYDPVSGEYVKKPLSQRWHVLADGSMRIQRDILSALLAFCAEDNGHNQSKILKVLAAAEELLRDSGWCRDLPRSTAVEVSASTKVSEMPHGESCGHNGQADCPKRPVQ